MDGFPSTRAQQDFDLDGADGAFQVRGRAGENYVLPGVEGYRLMEIMQLAGLPIPALCGGACACGTCHVYLDEGWLKRLPPPREDEEAKLDSLLHVQDNSRLACQIIWQKEAMDGLALALAPLEE